MDESLSVMQGTCQIHTWPEDQQTPALMDAINNQCNAVGKACSNRACSCHCEGLSCTPYCFCVGEAMDLNPFTKHDQNEARYDNEDEGDCT